MAIVQPIFMDKFEEFVNGLVHGGKVKIGGVYYDYNNLKTYRDKNIIRKYIEIEDVFGNIEEAQLLSESNEVLAIQPFDIKKSADGIALAFEFKLIVTEG